MARQGIKVVAISPQRPVSEELADIAFQFWLARCFRHGGSPEQALLHAVLEVTFRDRGTTGPLAIVRPGQRNDCSVSRIDTKKRCDSRIV